MSMAVELIELHESRTIPMLFEKLIHARKAEFGSIESKDFCWIDVLNLFHSGFFQSNEIRVETWLQNMGLTA